MHKTTHPAKSSYSAASISYFAGIVILLGIYLLAYLKKVPVSELTRDPAAITGSHFYTGILSNLGVLIWSVSASICLFTYAVLRTTSANQAFRSFSLYFGLLTTALLLDDFFMVHEISEAFLPSEDIIFAIYGLAALAGFLHYRKMILKAHAAVLLSALVFFSMSIMIDNLPENWLPWHHLYEDGFKFLGIIGWSCYFTTACFQALHDAFQLHQQPGVPITGNGNLNQADAGAHSCD